MNYQNTKEVKFYGLDQSMFTSNEDEGLEVKNQGQVNQSAQEKRQLGSKATANMKLRMKDPVPSKINLKSATKLDFLLGRNYTNVTYILNVRALPPSYLLQQANINFTENYTLHMDKGDLTPNYAHLNVVIIRALFNVFNRMASLCGIRCRSAGTSSRLSRLCSRSGTSS